MKTKMKMGKKSMKKMMPMGGMPMMKSGGMAKGYAKGGGIESKGKTRGKMC